MPTSLFIFLLIYFGIKNHRANGLTLWLLIASGVPMFLFSTSTLVVFVYTRKLILAQSNEEITPLSTSTASQYEYFGGLQYSVRVVITRFTGSSRWSIGHLLTNWSWSRRSRTQISTTISSCLFLSLESFLTFLVQFSISAHYPTNSTTRLFLLRILLFFLLCPCLYHGFYWATLLEDSETKKAQYRWSTTWKCLLCLSVFCSMQPEL